MKKIMIPNIKMHYFLAKIIIHLVNVEVDPSSGITKLD
jgi:hypothetical protein